MNTVIKDGKTMEILLPLGIVAAFIVLQMWVLPYFGIKTCMSGACGPSSAQRRANEQEHPGTGDVSTNRDPNIERKSP